MCADLLPLSRSPTGKCGLCRFRCGQPGRLDPNHVLHVAGKVAARTAHKYRLPSSIEWLYSLGNMSPMGYTPLHETANAHASLDQAISSNLRPFSVHCDARSSGLLEVGANRLSVSIAQRIFRDGSEEMWDFVVVLAKQGSDGTLKTQVLLCHPQWDDPVELVSIESNSHDVTVRLGNENPVT